MKTRKAFDALEQEFEAELPNVLRRAVESRDAGQEAVAGILDEFTEQCVHKVVVTLKELLRGFD